MEVLKAVNLTKIYGKGENQVRALDGVSLSVEQGQFAAVVGTSGSGKSTLLHMLGGLDRPDEGKVYVDGKDIFSLKEEALTIFRRRKIGFVFQSYNLVPVLSVYENVALPVELDGKKADRAFIEEILDTLGSLEPLRDPEGGAIALPVETDDYGTPQMTEHYPKPGDKLTVTYVDEGYYADSRTGEPVTDATPEEYIQYHIEKSHDVEYTVCALVTVPYQISFRASLMYGMDAIMGTEQLKADSGAKLYSLFYMFDTPNREAEEAAEHFLAELTEGETSPLMYESKALVRQDFQGFRQMFLLLGGALCAIVGVVGILNFFNAILTGILVRKREFAMLQAVGMTGRQLKKMLVTEGLLYAGATILLSLVLVFLLEPLVGGMLEDMFWFFAYHFDVTALWAAAPAFLLLGVVLPLGVYRGIARMTIVERLREVE